jgi:hypothetical protein
VEVPVVQQHGHSHPGASREVQLALHHPVQRMVPPTEAGRQVPDSQVLPEAVIQLRPMMEEAAGAVEAVLVAVQVPVQEPGAAGVVLSEADHHQGVVPAADHHQVAVQAGKDNPAKMLSTNSVLYSQEK